MTKKIDLLNRDDFIEKVIKLVNQLSENKKGCCFAIEGSWGIGKTFVIEEIENQLKVIQSEETADDRYFVFHYNCWKYDYYEEPSIAIISAMLSSIQEDNTVVNAEIDGTIQAGLEFAKDKLKEITGTYLENKIGVNLISIFEDIHNTKSKDKKEIYDFDKMFNFSQTIDKVRKNIQEIAEKRTIVLIVDELDRCIPSYAIKVLERLHHIFYGLENVVVIMAIDRNQLEHSVEEMFGTRNEAINIEKYLKKFIDFSMTLDNGTLNQSFSEKYKFYFDRFLDIKGTKDEETLNKILPILLEEIDIRSQEKIVEKANIVHSIVCNEKVDISVMLFEIMYEVFYFAGVGNMSWVAEINSAHYVGIEHSIGKEKMEFLKSMEKESWYGTSKSYGAMVTRDKKCILFNLYGKVFWYFANIFNKDDMPYIEQNGHDEVVEKQLGIAKKYCELCEIIK